MILRLHEHKGWWVGWAYIAEIIAAYSREKNPQPKRDLSQTYYSMIGIGQPGYRDIECLKCGGIGRIHVHSKMEVT